MITWYRGLSGIRYFHYNKYTVYISAIVALAIIIVMIPTATVLASESEKENSKFYNENGYLKSQTQRLAIN
jgi:hypothetical protein